MVYDFCSCWFLLIVIACCVVVSFFQQAVQKVGLIGLAIGMPNKASEALIEAALRAPKENPAEKVATVTPLFDVLLGFSQFFCLDFKLGQSKIEN